MRVHERFAKVIYNLHQASVVSHEEMSEASDPTIETLVAWRMRRYWHIHNLWSVFGTSLDAPEMLTIDGGQQRVLLTQPNKS